MNVVQGHYDSPEY